MEKKVSVCLGVEQGPGIEELGRGVAAGLNNVTLPEQTNCKQKPTLLSGVSFPGPGAGAQPIRIPKGGPARAESNCSPSTAHCGAEYSCPRAAELPNGFHSGWRPCAVAQPCCCFSLHCLLSLESFTPAWVRPREPGLLLLPLSRLSSFWRTISCSSGTPITPPSWIPADALFHGSPGD